MAPPATLSPKPIALRPIAPAPKPEVIEVSSHRTHCDGGGGALGHPRVYLEMGAQGFVECGYCDRRFVLDAHPHGESELKDPAAYEPADTPEA